MRTQVFYGNVELTRWCIVSSLRRPPLVREASSEQVPGRDGAILTGVRTLPSETVLTLTVKGGTDEDRQDALRSLKAALATDEPQRLAISIDNGIYQMALATFDGEITRYENASQFDVTFTAFDPISYGEQRTITVPSSGSVSFNVGGTYPTMPLISAPEAANGAGGFWKLAKEDGTYVIATVPDGLSSAPVVVDCAKRTLTVNSTSALLQPAADWLVLEPGDHTLTMTGTGAATVTFDERWM